MHAAATTPPILSDEPVPPMLAARTFAKHLLSLAFPLNALAYGLTGPHVWWQGLLFIVPIAAATIVDRRSPPHREQPLARMPALPFDLLVVVLSALQLLNVGLFVSAFQGQTWLSVDAFAGMVVVGSGSAWSGIVVAHELIHRPNKAWQTLGRLLLVSVMYEHFFTEHVRGHHARVGTADDPATARFGETFNRFYLRTVPAQVKSAWRLEAARLGDADMSLADPRLLRSRVLHGFVVQVALLGLVLHVLGTAALVVFLAQAWWATRALEVVNYFEHWGITRTTRRVLPQTSWDTHSAFTYYALTGLSRHADHHAFASRPYHKLRVWEESPVLPRGYLAMFPLVLAQNRKFQALMTEELRRKHLGPFARGADT